MKIYFLIAISLISIHASAQLNTAGQIPNKITNAFRLMYPAITGRKWAIKNDAYSVKFVSANKRSIAIFDTSGKWQQTETAVLSTKRLPALVKKGFYKSAFSSWYIEKIEKVDTPQDTSYKFLISNRNLLDGDRYDAFLQKYLLDFSIAGQLRRKTNLQ